MYIQGRVAGRPKKRRGDPEEKPRQFSMGSQVLAFPSQTQITSQYPDPAETEGRHSIPASVCVLDVDQSYNLSGAGQ